MIRFPSECSREGRMSRSMKKVFGVIDESALKDLPLQGGPLRGVEG